MSPSGPIRYSILIQPRSTYVNVNVNKCLLMFSVDRACTRNQTPIFTLSPHMKKALNLKSGAKFNGVRKDIDF